MQPDNIVVIYCVFRTAWPRRTIRPLRSLAVHTDVSVFGVSRGVRLRRTRYIDCVYTPFRNVQQARRTVITCSLPSVSANPHPCPHSPTHCTRQLAIWTVGGVGDYLLYSKRKTVFFRFSFFHFFFSIIALTKCTRLSRIPRTSFSLSLSRSLSLALIVLYSFITLDECTHDRFSSTPHNPSSQPPYYQFTPSFTVSNDLQINNLPLCSECLSGFI